MQVSLLFYSIYSFSSPHCLSSPDFFHSLAPTDVLSSVDIKVQYVTLGLTEFLLSVLFLSIFNLHKTALYSRPCFLGPCFTRHYSFKDPARLPCGAVLLLLWVLRGHQYPPPHPIPLPTTSSLIIPKRDTQLCPSPPTNDTLMCIPRCVLMDLGRVSLAGCAQSKVQGPRSADICLEYGQVPSSRAHGPLCPYPHP